MTFDEELENLETQAYQQLKSLPKGELRRQESWRSSTTGEGPNERSDAVNAVIDFKEHRRSSALGWAEEFGIKFVAEIRTQVCKKGDQGLGKIAEITPKTAASAIAAWIVASFGVTNPIAFAMATLVVLVLARALRGTFCSMTEDEIKGTIQASS